MAKRRMKTIRAGRLVSQAIYPVRYTSDSPPVRRAKQRCSSAAQAAMNRKTQIEKAAYRLAENFDVGDLLLTVTYGGSYPSSRRAAEERVKRYVAAIRSYFRAQHWPDPVIFWVTEENHGDGRLHHHLVIKAPPGKCFRALRALWRFGDIVDVRKIRVDGEKDYFSLARYLCKESPGVGRHQVHMTRNAGKPDVSTCWVAGDAQIRPVKGSMVLRCASVHEYQFGVGYQYSVYILPLHHKRPHRKK